MFFDIVTTDYAISNGLGYEGNGFMSGIVSNPILFILIKLIGSMVIIFMMSKIIQKNENIAKIGMKIIIFMMLFVISNNLLVITASALAFSNFTSSGTGSVNTGNGYFDDPATFFGYTGTRNIYVISEASEIYLVEPISWVSGTSPTAQQAINSSVATIKDGVVHNGYLYFIDGTTLLKKKTRNIDSPQTCEATDTTAGGCISIISTGVGEALRVNDGVLYYTKSTVLYHLDSDDNEVTDFDLGAGTIPGGGSAYTSFTIATNSSLVQAYVMRVAGGSVRAYECVAAGCQPLSAVLSATSISWASWYTTASQVYVLDSQVVGGNPTLESKYYISNNSAFVVDYASTNYLTQRNRVYVGGQSTIGIVVQSNISYETFNSNEAGTDSLPTVPTDLTYNTATIQSLDSTYYNKSDIYLNYNIVIDSISTDNILLDLDDYRWMISMEDPNGVTTDIVQSPACQYESILDTTCQITSTMGIHAPPAGWLQGSWNAKLYEINTVTSNRVLITTSSSFTVLNTTEENQSVVPPPFEPPTTGTAPQAISLIDGFVSWLGMGVNSVSKLLFAMIFIAIAATVGLIYGNGNIAMVFAFIPYAFFTFIDYIPKWIFIITIILMAIVSKAFR